MSKNIVSLFMSVWRIFQHVEILELREVILLLMLSVVGGIEGKVGGMDQSGESHQVVAIVGDHDQTVEIGALIMSTKSELDSIKDSLHLYQCDIQVEEAGEPLGDDYSTKKRKITWSRRRVASYPYIFKMISHIYIYICSITFIFIL
uniref:Uncharacterized protein n=1 Tax=Heterorhabditis bacteriophora TaxID=37862 RepID=A0A1I7WZB7_HETBA